MLSKYIKMVMTAGSTFVFMARSLVAWPWTNRSHVCIGVLEFEDVIFVCGPYNMSA